MSSPTVFEKDPTALIALHLGLTPEAAEQYRSGQMARTYRDYRIGGRDYRAVGRCAALDQHEDQTNERPSLDDVLEIFE